MRNYYAVSSAEIPSLLDDVVAAIRAGEPSGRWLALIDSAFDHGRRPMRWPAGSFPVYCQGKLNAFQSIAPVLLELATEDESSLRGDVRHLLRHCRGRPMLSFLHTGLEPQALLEAWQGVLEIETEDGESFLLRFADTRTTPAIASTLPSAWHRLSSNVGSWLHIDRTGKLQSLPPPRAESASEDETRTLRISDQALGELLESAQPDVLADTLNEHFPDLLSATDGALTHQRLTEVCRLAARSGIEAFPDLTALALAVLTTDGQLLADQGFSAWLVRRDYAPGELTDALDNYLEMQSA